jgi:hypothetical protein
MKQSDKQHPGKMDKNRDMPDRDKMKERGKQQQGEQTGGGQQQGGWDQGGQKGDMGRKPAVERDRDYDPDGDRAGRPDDPMRRI